MSKNVRILIADDHQLFLDGLKLILLEKDNLHVVGTAANGHEVISMLISQEIDIILLDINMPKLNGLETMKIINKRFPQVKVIGLSMLDEIYIVQKFIQLGAKGFLLKNSGKQSILDAIKHVMTGDSYYDHSILVKLMQPPASKKSNVSLYPKLSRREKEILRLIIEEFTTQEIAEKLFIAFGTVETHRRNIINKLGVRNTAGIVRVALEYNLLDD